MGSRDERAGEYGITHFIEHLLFKGTSKISASELARFFDRVGGYVNAFTERELMCLHCVVPAEYAREAIAILSDMVWDPKVSDADIERERTVIESEILSSLDDPEEMGMDAALALMYPGHSISRPIAGTRRDVEMITAESLRSFFSGRLHSCAPLIAIAGAVDATAMEAFFHERTVGLSFDTQYLTGEIPQWKAGTHYPVSKFTQSQIYLNYPIPFSRDTGDWYSWRLINAMIGNTVSSRLFQSLRERNGLCYSVYSSYAYGRDTAVWGAYVATPRENTAKTLTLLLAEMGDIAENGFRPEEIRDSKTNVVGDLSLSAEDTENRMKRLARQYLFGNTVYTLDECIAIVRGIDGDALSARVRDALGAERSSLVVYADKKAGKECAKKWR
jgi:predicted Zn-dependent peptidase